MHAHDVVGSHQPLDPLVVHRAAPAGQLGGDAGLAVGPVELVVDLADLRHQRGLGPLGVAGPGGLPGPPVTERLAADTSATWQAAVIGKPSAFRAATQR